MHLLQVVTSMKICIITILKARVQDDNINHQPEIWVSRGKKIKELLCNLFWNLEYSFLGIYLLSDELESDFQYESSQIRWFICLQAYFLRLPRAPFKCWIFRHFSFLVQFSWPPVDISAICAIFFVSRYLAKGEVERGELCLIWKIWQKNLCVSRVSKF